MAQDHLYGWMLRGGAINGRDGLDGIRMGRRRMTRYCKMSNLLWEDSLQTFFSIFFQRLLVRHQYSKVWLSLVCQALGCFYQSINSISYTSWWTSTFSSCHILRHGVCTGSENVETTQFSGALHLSGAGLGSKKT